MSSPPPWLVKRIRRILHSDMDDLVLGIQSDVEKIKKDVAHLQKHTGANTAITSLTEGKGE